MSQRLSVDLSAMLQELCLIAASRATSDEDRRYRHRHILYFLSSYSDTIKRHINLWTTDVSIESWIQRHTGHQEVNNE